MSEVKVDWADANPHVEAIIDGQRLPVYRREFFIPPKRVSVYENARGGPYKYCYYSPQLGRQVSFPLPFTPEIDALHAAGLL